MPELPLGFANKQESGLEELAGASPLAVNVLIDTKGSVRRRPGLKAFSPGVVDATGISCLHQTYGSKLFAVAAGGVERGIYRVTESGHALVGSPGIPNGLNGSLRPTVAETEMLLVFAGGEAMEKVELATDTPSRLSDGTAGALATSPPTSTHVVAMSSRLVVNDIREFTSWIRWSGIAQGLDTFAGLELWTEGIVVDGNSAGHISAEARPDPLVALYGNTNELFAFGINTTQVFAPDPSSVFAPVISLEYGCTAPYSVLTTDKDFAWLDSYGRIVLSDGRSVTDLSEPIKATLDEIQTVTDCFSFRYVEGPYDVMVWVFPTDGRAFAFQKGAGWSEWLGWSDSLANWRRLNIGAHFFSNLDNTNYVGTNDGFVCTLTRDSQTDLGTRIPAEVVTGFLHRGSDAKKKCDCVRISLRRGEATGEAPVAFLSWRDDPGPWGERIPVSLGSSADRTVVLEFRSLGVYRRRQWRFEFTGIEDITLVNASESFTILEQ